VTEPAAAIGRALAERGSDAEVVAIEHRMFAGRLERTDLPPPGRARPGH